MVRVSSKGQIVLPKGFREKMGIAEGDYLLIRGVGKGTMVLQTREEQPLWKQLEPLRKEAEEQGFTREELDELIHAIRAERKSDAA
jgi:AbrB family looped-hinge helix DNA binding protein